MQSESDNHWGWIFLGIGSNRSRVTPFTVLCFALMARFSYKFDIVVAKY